MNHKDIRFLHIFPLRGPNLWTYHPVLEAWVDIGELEEWPSHTIPGFVDRLCGCLPTLSAHRCSYGEPGGFVRRLIEGTWTPHILEHVTLELQNLAGMPGGFGRARETDERGIYKVVVSAWDEEFTRVCLHEARDLVMAAIEDRDYELAPVMERLRKMSQQVYLEPGTRCIVEAATAKTRGIPAIRLPAANLIQLGQGARQRRIWAATTECTGAIAGGIALSPDLTNQLLEECGLPVPLRRHAANAADAWEAAEEIGLPVVLKPGDFAPGDDGTAAADRPELEKIYQKLAESSPDVIVEGASAGGVHQLLVVAGEVVAAVRIEDGITRDVTADVHPATVAAACLATRVVGLDIAGVDVVAGRIAEPLAAQRGAITALHAGPSLLPYLEAAADPPPPIGLKIVDHLFPDGDQGRIPLVGVTGSCGTTEVARLVAEFLRLGGKTTGLACADGLFAGRHQVEHGDCGNWRHARHVLMNRAMEAAVLENNADVILGQGLAYDRCQVGVVTGIEPEQHFGRYYLTTPEHVFRVFRTQVDVVLPGGAAVLPAGDPLAEEMIPLCDGEVILFGADPALPVIHSHLAGGGRAVLADDGRLLLAAGRERTPLVDLSGIPFVTAGPTAARTASVLAAVGAAWALGIPNHVIRTGLETFACVAAGSPDIQDPQVSGPLVNPP
jgi:cyanophycin synthetase